jgi:subtilisin family serine protease
VAGLTAASLSPAHAVTDPGPSGSDQVSASSLEARAANRYVVVMDDDPLVATVGQDAVRSARGKAEAKRLEAEQDKALKAVGKKASDKTYSYTVALNGFATQLTEAQAAKLANVKGVQRVLHDVVRQPTASTDPVSGAAGSRGSGTGGSGSGSRDSESRTPPSPESFLGLSGRKGVWADGHTGEGVVVGVIDSGIWPEHPSFADDGTYPVPDVAPGIPCDFGNTAANPADAPFTCNHKLVGARQMLSTYRALIGQEPDEYDSARDDDGHGTHTASTAAGNQDVPAEILGIDRGTVSGVAPRAQIIAYKGLGNLGGFSSDLAAAINQAVADGVDVINYSVGGGPSLTGADDLAFLFAADAGVFVATSAGNSGPADASIGGPASVPWLTSVGASTQPRFFQGTVELGNHRRYEGASITTGTGWLDLVDAADAGGDLCVPGTLDTAKVSGKLVLCRRGQVGRAAKSLAVQQAGGLGMVLYNNVDVDNLFTDNHFVPSVHVDNTPGVKIKDYIASGRNPRARIIADQLSSLRFAPSVTYFSSRGPDPVAEDIIKPDITATGHQVLAGNSPTPDPGASAPGELFQAISGTSMSSPQIAGAFALLKQAHPDWSAAAAKSALMTTAYQRVVDYDRKSRATPFSMGSGHLDLAGQQDEGTPFDPGLVYDAGFLDYLGFLCDADPSVLSADTCPFLTSQGVPTQAEDLNYPSIGVAAVTGSATVQRTVTNVSGSKRTAEYEAKVKAPPGYAVSVSPRKLKLKGGESATFSVTITNTSAPVGEWRFGSLTWEGDHRDVYSPIAVRASLFDAPASASGTGDTGSVDIPVTFGYTGSYTAGAHGLVAATVTTGSVEQDPDQVFDPMDGYSDAVPITVSDAALLRVALPPDGVTDPNVDIDLFLYDPSGTQVASSTNAGTDEHIDVPNPVNGTWTLYVHGWQTVAASADYTLYDWVVPAAPGGGSLSITAAPASATAGATETVTAAWTGAAGTWNLGAVSHTGETGLMGLTLVDVDNR